MGDLGPPSLEDLASPLCAKLGPGSSRWGGFNAIKRVSETIRDLATMDVTMILAFVASIGNLLQGWDNASIAGSMLYIKKEFHLQSMPMIEGSIMAMALVGATIITSVSGFLADTFGRRMMLLASAVMSLVSALLVIFWSQHVYMLLFARLIEGFSIGLAVTLVPVYISEIAHSEIRGKLNTFPQLCGSGGMCISYCMVFWMSLMPKVQWRIMLGIQSIPSLIYCVLIIFYLPETPSWLVNQGRVDDAKKVLQRLRRRDDVSVEMASLLEGIGVGHTPCVEEYLISSDDKTIYGNLNVNDEIIKLYGIGEDSPCVAYPAKREIIDENATALSASTYFDPLVSLIGSVQGNFPKADDIFNEIENIYSEVEHQGATTWDEENLEEPKEYETEEDSVYEPLICPLKGVERTEMSYQSGYIGGGWQLAWMHRNMEGYLERVYLHGGGVPSSQNDSKVDLPACGKFIQATALVNKSVFPRSNSGNYNIDFQSVEKEFEGTIWENLWEPGVKRALIVGVGIQILQQFAGINGILYYTPQILEQAGVVDLLSKIGLSSSSVSILMSGLTTLLMLPFIGIAMWLMDRLGRRQLLLNTIPILLVSLIVLVVVNIVDMSIKLHAVLSTTSVVIYFCIFVTGFGPIPNIFCSEIFPTRVRAICITICSLTFWICDIIVTYTLPMLMRSIGLAGVFGLYAFVCALSLLFVYLKVPETKGLPIEVVAEFYALGAVGHPKVDLKEERK